MSKFIETVFHPQTNELSMDITFDVSNGADLAYCGDSGMCDGYPTLEEARENVQGILQYYYSGEYAKDEAESKRYSRQESLACGNY